MPYTQREMRTPITMVRWIGAGLALRPGNSLRTGPSAGSGFGNGCSLATMGGNRFL
jgi:hypothetical protein